MDERYQAALARLENFQYPVYLIVNGPENSHRTRFRREHGGYTENQMIYNSKEGKAILDRCMNSYEGHFHNVDITVIYYDDKHGEYDSNEQWVCDGLKEESL